MNKYLQLLKEADELQRQAEAKRKEALNFKCTTHQWGEVSYNPKIQKGYFFVGDRSGDPGYDGVDRRFDTYVPDTATPKWERTCKCCGFKQETVTTKTITGHDGLKHETPDFDLIP